MRNKYKQMVIAKKLFYPKPFFKTLYVFSDMIFRRSYCKCKYLWLQLHKECFAVFRP